MKFGMWDEVRMLLRTPDALQLVEYRASSLWWACTMKDVPLDIIELLHQISPSQAWYRDNLSGRTPLHRAVRFSSLEVVELLLQLAPELVSTVDNGGNLPLHIGIQKSHSFVCALLLMYPSGLHIKNNLGRSPAEMFFSKWEVFIECRFMNIEKPVNLYHIIDYGEGLLDLKHSVLLIIKALRNETLQKSKNDSYSFKNITASMINFVTSEIWLPIHESIKLGPSNIPPAIVQFLAVTTQSELCERDSEGNSLLHLSVTGPQYDNLSRFLLKYQMSLASTPNYNGRLPMNIAIESGMKWDSGILKALINAAPDTISLMDSYTNLYPFMISLCSKNSDLDVAYELLRMCPSIIGFR